MINSLCGSVGTLKSENSCTKPPPTSPNESVTESKKTTTTCNSTAPPSSDLEQNSLTPTSLNLPNLKFELDIGDVEVPSPTSSLWESFFSDQLDGDYMISSPVRNYPSPQASAYNYNYNYAQAMQGQSTLSGSSPPRFSSTQIGPFTSTQKGKGLSPLHRVFNSPNNQYMKSENLSVLSSIEEFLDDYGRHEYEYLAKATKLSGIGSSSHYDMPIMVPAVDGLTMNNSSTFCGSVHETSSTPGGSQAAPERDIYDQMGIMPSAPLSQQLQQERLQEKQLLQKQPQQQTPDQQQHHNLNHSLMVQALPVGSEQVINIISINIFTYPHAPCFYIFTIISLKLKKLQKLSILVSFVIKYIIMEV